MNTPWPNAAYAYADTADRADKPAPVATPANIAKAHLFLAKNHLGSVALFTGWTLSQVSDVINSLAYRADPLLSGSVADYLGWVVGTGTFLSFGAFLFLFAKTDFSVDQEEQYRLAPHRSWGTKSKALNIAFSMIIMAVMLIAYFGAGWLEKHNRVPNGFGELAQVMLFMLPLAMFGWSTITHFKRAKEIQATL
jgi:hypothetical protein